MKIDSNLGPELDFNKQSNYRLIKSSNSQKKNVSLLLEIPRILISFGAIHEISYMYNFNFKFYFHISPSFIDGFPFVIIGRSFLSCIQINAKILNSYNL